MIKLVRAMIEYFAAAAGITDAAKEQEILSFSASLASGTEVSLKLFPTCLTVSFIHVSPFINLPACQESSEVACFHCGTRITEYMP